MGPLVEDTGSGRQLPAAGVFIGGRVEQKARMKVIEMPSTARGQQNEAAENSMARLGDKRAVAEMAGGMSVRWVDSQLAAGMPHVRIGTRRVRFDLAEVREWLKSKYGPQRRAA